MTHDQDPIQPPAGPPPTGAPETLDSHAGRPLPRERGPRRPRRTAALIAAGVGVVAAGGAAWAAWSFFSTGAQPAEALPASTLAYVSIDLDPNGGQKIEALRTLRKFPAFKDKVGISADGDLRKWIIEEAASDGGCDLDYGKDVEPWLGNRFAVAAVDAGGDGPAPVFAVQVTDGDAADRGLTALRSCGDGSGSGDDIAWSIHDGWAVVGETQDVVDQVADDAADHPLSEDGDFKHWTGEAGDDGILTAYVAPAAGDMLADAVGDGLDEAAGPIELLTPIDPREELRSTLKKFQGTAASVRFADGGLELAVASDGSALGKASYGDTAGTAAADLPTDTLAALSLSPGDGWAERLVKQLGDDATSPSSVEDMTGLTLPDDIDTLLGDSVTIALGPGFSPKSLFTSSPGGSGPKDFGVRIDGDADAIQGVLGKLRTSAGGEDEGFFDSDAGDGVVAVGPDAAYRAELTKSGDLGGTGSFKRVIEHADDASAVLYLSLDGADDWLADLSSDEATANLAPLSALGLSAWLDGDTTHAVLKITTD